MFAQLGLYIKKSNSAHFLLLKKGSIFPLTPGRTPHSEQQMINSIKELQSIKHEWIHNGTDDYRTAKYLIQPIESHLRTAPPLVDILDRHAGNG